MSEQWGVGNMSVRKFTGRSQSRVSKRLGVISSREDGNNGDVSQTFRNAMLDEYDAYYERRQYDHLQPWDEKLSGDNGYVKMKDRAPKLNYNFAKVLCCRLASKLVGKKNFPTWKTEGDPDTEDFYRKILQSSSLRAKLVEPVRRCLNSGSVFVRFSLVNGQWKIEHYLAKWCFPTFDANNDLESIEIKYVYEDPEDLDEHGEPVKKWFKMELTKTSDIMYDSPTYDSSSEPEFSVVDRADHGLGFVQGEWLVTSEETNSIDGQSIVGDILEFIDELNYSISQTSDAVSYNQDPQLLLQNMDEEEINQLVRSSEKAWNLGREGDAKLLEASMTGPEMAIEFRGKVRLSIQDLARIVLLDPEKVVTHASSGRAMEVLHGPMVELVEELQPQFEGHIRNLMMKMALTNAIQARKFAAVPVNMPEGYNPINFFPIASFPPVFPQTIEDLQKKVSVAVQAASGNIISRETMTRWLAKDFDIEDIEEELAKIENQPVINPFGSF